MVGNFLMATAIPRVLQSQPAQSRLLWIDVAKGIGICLVVFGHATNGLVTAGVLHWEAPLKHVFYFIYTFHMPLFFFISGITVRRSLQKGTLEFITGKARHILYPYFVWSVIQGLSQLTLSDQLNTPYGTGALYGIFLHPIGHFWFLYILMMYHLLAAAAGGRSSILIPVSIIGLFVYSDFSRIPSLGAYYLFSYVAGIVLHDVASRSIAKLRYPGTVGFLSLAACAFLAMWAASATGWDYVNPLNLPATAFGIFGVLALSKLAETSANSTILAYLGRLSLSIYVMHVMAAAGTRIILVNLHLVQDPYALLALCTASGVILPVIAHKIFDQLNLLRLLGLESSSAGRSLRQANA
jgi:fucose 4-O-acetylase-like acetyltransferase